MNYFAHALDSLDRPWVAAGTAVPDWLRLADRRTRLHAEDLGQWSAKGGRVGALLAEGVGLHLAEDARFHGSARFESLCRAVTADLRGLPSRSPRFRASVAAHILVEMLLDASLDRQFPGQLELYYSTLDRLDADELRRGLGEIIPARVANQTAEVFLRFRRSRFLLDYREDPGLCHHLRRVLERARLGNLPTECVDRLPEYRDWVEAECQPLLQEVRPPR